MLIGSPADKAKEALNKNLRDTLGFEIVGSIPIEGYDQIPDVKAQLDQLGYDLCLLAAWDERAYFGNIHRNGPRQSGAGILGSG